MATYRIFRGRYTGQIGSINESRPTEPIQIRVACTDKYWLWINGYLVVFAGGVNRGPTPTDGYFDTVNIRPFVKVGDNIITVLVETFGRESGNLNPARAASQTGAANDSNDLKGGLYIDTIEEPLVHNMEDIRTQSGSGGAGLGPSWKITTFSNFLAPSSDEAHERLLERDTKFDLGGAYGTISWEPYLLADQNFVNGEFAPSSDQEATRWIWDYDYDDSGWTDATEHGSPTFFETDATAQPTGDAAWFGRLHNRDIPLVPAIDRTSFSIARDVTSLTLGWGTGSPPQFEDPAGGVLFLNPIFPFSYTVQKQIAFKLDRNRMFVPGVRATGSNGDVITVYTNQIDTGDTAVSPSASHYFKYEIELTGASGESWEATNAFNGDYLIVDIPANVEIHDVWYRDVGYQAERGGSFTCSDADIQNIVDKSFNTLEVTILDTPVDNPDRQRLQTPGDGMTIMNSAYYGWSYKSIHPLNRKMLRAFHYWYNFGPGEGADVPALAPYTEENGASAIKRDPVFRMRDAAPAGPNYTALTVDDASATGNLNIAGESIAYEIPSMALATFGLQGLWRYYLQTGDLETISLLFDDIDDYLTSFKEADTDVADQLDSDDMVLLKGEHTRAEGDYSDSFALQWFDWYDTESGTSQSGLWSGNSNATEADWKLLNTAWWYMCAKAWRSMAVETGQTGHANYTAYGTAISDIESKFSGSDLWNNGHSEDAYKSPGFTHTADQRANALLALAGLVPSSRYANIRDLLWQDSAYTPKGGIWAEWWILGALFEMGYADEAIKRIKKRFDTDHGLINDWRTVIPEFWEGPVKGSHSQGWGAFLVETAGRWMAGVNPTSAGYATYDVYPRPGGMSSIDYTLNTVKGDVRVVFEEVDSDTNHFTYTTLSGSTSTLYIDRDTAAEEQVLLGFGTEAVTLWDDIGGLNLSPPSGFSLTINSDTIEVEFNNATLTDSVHNIRYEHQVDVEPVDVETVTLPQRDGVLLNPHCGVDSRWYRIAKGPTPTCGYLRSSGIGGEGLQYSQYWSDLVYFENGEQKYRFDEQIGTVLNTIETRSQNVGAGAEDVITVALRFLAQNPWIEEGRGIPAYVDEQLEHQTVNFNGMIREIAILDNPVYLQEATTFLQAFKDWLDAHPKKHLIEYIDISLIGYSGEWNYFFNGMDHNQLLPSVAFCKQLIDAFFSVFKPGGANDVELIMPYGSRNVPNQLFPGGLSNGGYELIKYACLDKAEGAGWRADNFGKCSEIGDYEDMYNTVPGMETLWQSHPVVLEVWDTIRSWDDASWRQSVGVANCAPEEGYLINSPHGMLQFAALRHHMSHFYPLNAEVLSWSNSDPSELQQAILDMQKVTGYRLWVNQVSYAKNISSGSDVTFHVNIRNIGGAPNYSTFETYKLYVTVGNREASATVPAILPGSNQVVPVEVLDVETGTDVKVFIRVRAEQRQCDVELANEQDEGAGFVHRYNVSTITIT